MSHLRFKVIEEAFDRKAIPVEIPIERPEEYYGKYVFNRKKMLEYLPRVSCRRDLCLIQIPCVYQQH